MSRVVVTGAGGLLGRELVVAYRAAGHVVDALTRADVDLERPETMARISETEPEIVVNSAAWTDVDGCARDAERAMRINGHGAGLVAAAAARSGALVIQISTNEVFDGAAARAYDEEDAPNPINLYGASKLAGERGVTAATDWHLIVRTSWLFGPERGFPARIRVAADRAIAAGEPLRVVDDEWGNPTPVVPLARAIVITAAHALRPDGPRILHLAGEPPTSRHAWAEAILAARDVAVERMWQTDYHRDSAVPPHAVLATHRAQELGIPMISWQAPVPGGTR